MIPKINIIEYLMKLKLNNFKIDIQKMNLISCYCTID